MKANSIFYDAHHHIFRFGLLCLKLILPVAFVWILVGFFLPGLQGFLGALLLTVAALALAGLVVGFLWGAWFT